MNTRAITLVLLALVLIPPLAQALPGDIDPSFGAAGLLRSPYGGDTTAATAADGRMVVYRTTAEGLVLRLRRYTTDGQVDSTWAGGGEARIDLGSLPQITRLGRELASDQLLSVAPLPDGAVVLAYEGVLLRLRSDGSVDHTLAGSGIVDLRSDGSAHSVSALTADADGGALFVVGCDDCSDFVILDGVRRLRPDGTLENLTAGTSAHDFGSLVGWTIVALCRLQDGRLIVVGGDGITCFDASGKPDVRYAGQGVVRMQSRPDAAPQATLLGPTLLQLTGLTYDSRSQIVATTAVIATDGRVTLTAWIPVLVTVPAGITFQTAYMVLVALRSDGQLDAGFGPTGNGLFLPDWSSTPWSSLPPVGSPFTLAASAGGTLVLSGVRPYVSPGVPVRQMIYLWRLDARGREIPGPWPAGPQVVGHDNPWLAPHLVRVLDDGTVIGQLGWAWVRFAQAPAASAGVLVPGGSATALESESASAGGVTVVSIPVTRTGGSRGALTIVYATGASASQTATAGSDYRPANGQLSWADGESGTKFIDITVLDDALQEDGEYFQLDFSGRDSATLASSTTLLYIRPSDPSPQLPSSVTITTSASASSSASGSGSGGGGALSPASLLMLCLVALVRRRSSACGSAPRALALRGSRG